MEDNSTSIESLVDRLKDYAETRIDLVKLKAINKASGILSMLVTQLILILSVTIFIIFLDLAIAFYLGEATGKMYCGFLIVAGLNLVAGLIVFLSKKGIKRFICNI